MPECLQLLAPDAAYALLLLLLHFVCAAATAVLNKHAALCKDCLLAFAKGPCLVSARFVRPILELILWPDCNFPLWQAGAI